MHCNALSAIRWHRHICRYRCSYFIIIIIIHNNTLTFPVTESGVYFAQRVTSQQMKEDCHSNYDAMPPLHSHLQRCRGSRPTWSHRLLMPLINQLQIYSAVWMLKTVDLTTPSERRLQFTLYGTVTVMQFASLGEIRESNCHRMWPNGGVSGVTSSLRTLFYASDLLATSLSQVHRPTTASTHADDKLTAAASDVSKDCSGSERWPITIQTTSHQHSLGGVGSHRTRHHKTASRSLSRMEFIKMAFCSTSTYHFWFLPVHQSSNPNKIAESLNLKAGTLSMILTVVITAENDWRDIRWIAFIAFKLQCLAIADFLPRCMEYRRGLAMKKLSVRPSVRPSNAWIVTKQKKDLFRFLYHTKDHLA